MAVLAQYISVRATDVRTKLLRIIETIFRVK